MLAENTPGAYLTLLWGSIFFDVMAFTLPHFFDAYNNSLVPYDADHVIERFTRLLIIMFGQSIAASVSGRLYHFYSVHSSSPLLKQVNTLIRYGHNGIS